MTDDELIERLRHSLRERAENLQPNPGYLGAPPVPGTTPGPTTAAPTAAALWPAGPAGPPTSEYQLLSPTGAVPVIGRRNRRWLAGSAVVIAAAAIALAVVLPGGSHPVSVRPAQSSTPANPTTSVLPPAPATSVPASPTSVATGPASPPPVPAGFEPESATFVSAADGWVIGSVPCSGRLCPAVTRTTDGGATWFLTGSPDLAVANGPFGQLNVRFADAEVGWAWADRPGADPPSELFRTTDGGATWQAQSWGFPGSTIADLEISGGWAQLVAYGPCANAATSLCQGQTVEEIFEAPIAAPKWAEEFVEPDVGAGPVLAPELTLSARTGWLINDNRTTVSAARLAGGVWQSWTPPCANANGPAHLGAASLEQLVAVCGEGVWGPPAPGTTADADWLWTSVDGGATFHAVAEVPGTQAASVSAAPDNPSTIALADPGMGLLMSFDGGRTWQTEVAAASAAGAGIDFVGFTTADQAVALAEPASPAMYMTHDGGHSWQRVTFGS